MVLAIITILFGAILGIINFVINIFKKTFHFIFEKGGLFVKIMQSDALNIRKLKKFKANRIKMFKMNDEI